MYEGNYVFSAETAGGVFSEPLSYQEVKNKWTCIDTIISFDPFTGEQLPDTIIYYIPDITALRVLELNDGRNVFPVAICLGRIKYDDDGNPVGTRPILWVPINNQLITELDSYQAYLPGYPQQLTLWGYLLSDMYKGKIISERPIDNAEWQKMREFLK